MAKLRALIAARWVLPVVAAVIIVALGGAIYLDLTRARSAARTAASAPVSPLSVSSPPSPRSPAAPASPSPFPSPSPWASPPHNPAYPPYEYSASGAAPPEYATASQAKPSDATLSCRLPIYAGGLGSGGFIDFPGGSFTADPRSAVALPPPPANYTPPPGPGGSLFFGLSYDRAYSRWLPVQRNWVSPDGKNYAYVYPGANGIYIFNVTSGGSTEIGAGNAWYLLDLEAQGAYAMALASGQIQAGLWYLPLTGAPVEVVRTGYWQAAGFGAAYGTETSAVPNGASNTIIRLELKTGTQQKWFMVDTGQSNVIGFDLAGTPLIQDYFNDPNFNGRYGSEIWDVPAPGQAQVIEPDQSQQGIGFGNPIADKNGIWFSSGNTIFLFRAGHGTFTASNLGGQLAGGCA